MYNDKLRQLGVGMIYNGKEYYKINNKIIRILKTDEEWVAVKDDIFWSYMPSEEFYNKIANKMIEVKWIKRPKGKPVSKLKLDGCTYYISDLGDSLVVFLYKSYTKEKVKSEVIASVFNKISCKGEDYMTLARVYDEELNRFNKEDFIHSQYVTSSILDEVYKLINKE